MGEKYTERYHSFCKSLESLERALDRDRTDEFVISGTVQKFALTFDISWKVMKDILVKYHGVSNFAAGSPRETLRSAAQAGLITDDRWISMLKDRNNLAHDYDGSLAEEKTDVILNVYLPLLAEFRRRAAEIFAKKPDL